VINDVVEQRVFCLNQGIMQETKFILYSYYC